jgi:alpha-tubulin suppressor-like RCC1 family protein
MVASFLSELNLINISFRINPSTPRNRYEPTLLIDTDTSDMLEWIQIECGGSYTVGLTKNGQVFTWGVNRSGQLGHSDEKERIVPKKVEGLDGIKIITVSCGTYHTAALTDKGEILTRYVRS